MVLARSQPPCRTARAFRALIALACLSSCHLFRHADDPEPIEALLPVGEHDAMIMVLGAPDPWSELAARFQAAAARDPEWMREHVRKAVPGEDLPYHPRLGLTEEEYAEFLRLTKEMRLVPAEPATLRIFRAKDGRFGFEGDSVLSRLNGIELDPATRTVHTPVGSCAGYEPISVSPTAPVGAWVGFNCRHEEEPTDSGRAVLIAFSIGRRAEEQDALLTYRMKTVQGWQVTERADIFVTFPLP